MRLTSRLLPASILLIGIVFAGCATLPPAKPIHNVKSIAGKWEGVLSMASGMVPNTLIFKEDGSWKGAIGSDTTEGVMRVSGGKIRMKSHTTGREYTVTLHEGDGKRVFSLRSDDGKITGKFRPAK